MAAEQPVRLGIDVDGNVERIEIATHLAVPEDQVPKATRRVAAAWIDRDRADERPGYRVKGVDLAGCSAEIADQKIAAELAETRRGQSELAAGDQPLQRAAAESSSWMSHAWWWTTQVRERRPRTRSDSQEPGRSAAEP